MLALGVVLLKHIHSKDFKGYKNNQLVVTKKVGPSKQFDLEVEVSRNVLENKETYDCLPIHLRHVDENGSIMQYSNRVISVESEGPIKILGDKHQALLGGQLTIYVQSLNKTGNAKINISMDDISKEIDLVVR